MARWSVLACLWARFNAWARNCADYLATAAAYEGLSRLSDAQLRHRSLRRDVLARDLGEMRHRASETRSQPASDIRAFTPKRHLPFSELRTSAKCLEASKPRRGRTASSIEAAKREGLPMLKPLRPMAMLLLGAFILFAMLLAAIVPARAVDLDEMTVVTMAGDGSWGVATAGSQGEAIAAAIRECRAMAAGPSDCGAQFTTMRGGWVIASLCGTHKIIVTSDTLDNAEQAALARELQVNLKRLRVADASLCRRVLMVDPHGTVVPVQAVAHRLDAAR